MGHASGADGKSFRLRHENRAAEMWASEKHLKAAEKRVEASECSVALFQKHAIWCPYESGPNSCVQMDRAIGTLSAVTILVSVCALVPQVQPVFSDTVGRRENAEGSRPSRARWQRC